LVRIAFNQLEEFTPEELVGFICKEPAEENAADDIWKFPLEAALPLVHLKLFEPSLPVVPVPIGPVVPVAPVLP
jgi:hypothetical protein